MKALSLPAVGGGPIAVFIVGAFILGRPLSIPNEGIELLKDPHLFSRDYYRRLFVQSWNSIVWPFAIGGTVLSVVCSLLAYPLTLRALRAYRAVKDHRKRIDL